MDLVDVASYFDNTDVSDGYSTALLFQAQIDLFDDSKRDGVGTDRRVISIDPRLAVSIPTHRLVSMAGERWVVGNEQPDEFQGDLIRHKYVVQQADFSLQHGTFHSRLSGTTLTQEYVGSAWLKDQKYENATSEVRPVYALYTGINSAVASSDFMLLDGAPYYARAVYVTAAGFRCVEAIQLPADCEQTVKYAAASASIDSVTGKPSSPTTADVSAVVMPFFDEYRLVTQAQLRPSAGDLQMRTLPVTGLKAGDSFTVAGRKMRVVTYLNEPDGSILVHLTN